MVRTLNYREAIDYIEEIEPYKDIEITRYLLDDKVVNTDGF